MAIKATIYKAKLQITDMDRHYYQDHSLTIARHPSENDLRMMVRLLAFALHAHEDLSFSKGLCADDEPAIWQKNFSDDIEVWIDLGQPDEKRIRQACGRAKRVVIYTYHERSAYIWLHSMQHKLQRFDHLEILLIPDAALEMMGEMAQRNMQLQYTMQDAEILLGDGLESIRMTPIMLVTASKL